MHSIKLEETIFTEVLACGDSPEARDACLTELCGHDSELRERVEELLTAFAHPDELFSSPQLTHEPFCPEVAPRQLGEFELLGELGRGGMGIVYEARQQSLNRRVAVKVMSKGLRLSSNAISRFHREAEAAARLHHTNIVRVYTTGTEEHVPYFVMELIEGPSLDRLIAHWRHTSAGRGCDSTINALPDSTFGIPPGTEPSESEVPQRWEETLDAIAFEPNLAFFRRLALLLADVADGLAHGHAHGVVHRDIKPGNLLLAPDGKLVINDFGLARLLEEPGVTTTGEFLGTPVYMSPELVSSGRSQVDPRTDIYSLGATLYELMTLRAPFQGEARDQVLLQVMHKDPVTPHVVHAQVPRDLETICLKAMEKGPADRYASAEDMAQDLRRFANGEMITARRLGLPTKLVRWSRQNRIAASMAGMVVVASLFASWFAMRDRFRYDAVKANVKNLLAEGHPLDALRMTIDSGFWERLDDEPFYESAFGHQTTIASDPPGARIFVRPARGSSTRWLELGTAGTSPLKVPLEFELRWHWKAELEGHAPEYRLTEIHTLNRYDFLFSSAPGMQAIPATKHTLGTNERRISWLECRQLQPLKAFQLDRYEVTNAEFAQFVAAGGYETSEYWQDQLGESWRETILAHFLDQRGQVGPKLWQGGIFREGEADVPVVGISWYEAAAYAKWKQKKLPTIHHWLHAARFQGCDDVELVRHSNIGGKLTYPWKSRGQEDRLSVNYYGVFDLSGNVREWCLNEEQPGRYYALGGSFEAAINATYFPQSVPAMERPVDVGFRCAAYEESGDALAAAPFGYRDASNVVKHDIQPLRSLFEFDADRPFNATPLARCESSYTLPRWRYDASSPWDVKSVRDMGRSIHDNIDVFQIDGPDGEPIPCFVAWPDAGARPPYQPVLLCSGFGKSNATLGDPPADLMDCNAQVLLAAGRVLIAPIYFGTHYRFDPGCTACTPDSAAPEKFEASAIRFAQDFSRVVDFLVRGKGHELHNKIDAESLAFFGKNTGANLAPLLLVTDELRAGRKRIQSCLFVQAGWVQAEYPFAVDQMTYVPHLDTPTMIFNVASNVFFPPDISQLPLYETLPGEDGRTKQHIMMPRARWSGVPEATFQKHAIPWLDQWQAANL